MLHQETVEKGTLDLIRRFMQDSKFNSFYLVGGTALALRIGHRKSIDIDLFTDNAFQSTEIKAHLQDFYSVENIRAISNGVFSVVDGVKVDIIAHQYPLLSKIEETEGIRMLSLLDISAMKLNAIHGNGTRLKDFIDIYALLEYMPLEDMLKACERKYPDVNAAMARNALLYHDDIDHEVKIDFIGKPIEWQLVSERLKQAATNPKLTFKPQQSLKQSRNIRQDRKKGPRL
ncbi:MAG: hypothetical protein BGP14_05175 [Sphingobacteriales bacterium 44-15]|uniref:nucleotidyl transferase AbiEii/AbiGii toxin family protein n=1 Tax=uncultured Dysgonomonas sp. TaxID=206096 RepID=UPI00095D951C|nr:nucleotidyl transferase AbiEii/AbiGii toxin family protein [uncultured Dysgonomonas sp.]OJY89297.1 MAG: hypothetical protein BGP14_05175 [Sphingobacteriales bacterium 44-15]